MKIEAIINASSGVGHDENLEQRLIDGFATAGAEARIHVAQTGDELTSLTKKATEGSADVIVAGGGDGTINLVAAHVLAKNRVLGVLPFGTLNHFAKDLQLPLDLEGAIATIAAGHESLVDVGEVNENIFINNSSLGLYPRIVHERERQQSLGWGKGPAYVWAGLATLRRYPFLNVRVDVDGQALKRRTPFVFIGNNEYQMETFNIGGRERLDKGELSLYITNRTGRLGLLRLATRALFGGLHQEKDFLALGAKEIWIETRHKHLRVALDGEVKLLHPPLHYQIRPQVLRVLTAMSPKSNGQSPRSAT
ncbi:MAG TPA: diacylglycerol kinase family protein [Pyrinomonadaceae bacterium]|nr:diacylglycerol kinase family protein [Pyrinomonadaceae bacterium]